MHVKQHYVYVRSINDILYMICIWINNVSNRWYLMWQAMRAGTVKISWHLMILIIYHVKEGILQICEAIWQKKITAFGSTKSYFGWMSRLHVTHVTHNPSISYACKWTVVVMSHMVKQSWVLAPFKILQWNQAIWRLISRIHRQWIYMVAPQNKIHLLKNKTH